MFEHMNQVVKHSALRNNFRNTLMAASTQLAQTLAFDLYCGRHTDFMKPILEVRFTEMCVPGASPTIDLVVARGISKFDQGTLSVQWLSKAKIANSAFGIGDIVHAGMLAPYAQTRSYYVALILDMFAIGPHMLIQLVCLKEATASTAKEALPSLTWSELKSASQASLDYSIFVESSALNLQLLHPTGRASNPTELRFISW